jgi:hypothetical protein
MSVSAVHGWSGASALKGVANGNYSVRPGYFMSLSSVSVEESYLQIFGLGAQAEGLVVEYNRFLNGELYSWIGE